MLARGASERWEPKSSAKYPKYAKIASKSSIFDLASQRVGFLSRLISFGENEVIFFTDDWLAAGWLGRFRIY